MKKLLTAAAMVVVLAGAASAQGGGGGGGMGGGRGAMTPEQMAARMAQQVDVMFKDITITDAIKAKAVEVLTKANTDRMALDRQAADYQEKSAGLITARNASLAALLSNDGDKAKLADNIKNMPAGRGRPAPPTL